MSKQDQGDYVDRHYQAASPASSFMASFQSAYSDSSMDNYTTQESESSPLLKKDASRKVGSESSADSFHSCQLTPMTDAGSDQDQRQLLHYGREEGTSIRDSSRHCQCFPRLKSKSGDLLCCCNSHFGVGFISCVTMLKPYLLFVMAVIFSVMIAAKGPQSTTEHLLSVSSEEPIYFTVEKAGIILELTGPFYSTDAADTKSVHNISVFASCTKKGERRQVTTYTLTGKWANNSASSVRTEKFVFQENTLVGLCKIHIETHSTRPIPLTYTVNHLPKAAALQPWFALVILIVVYLFIILDLTHRAIAAMFGGLATVAVLTMLNKGPRLEDIFGWIGRDIETLSLLFGMMIIVSILAETGLFSFVALKAFRYSNGKIWYLITSLCLISAVVSAFLDNVTTILLLTPVTIRLCEVSNVDPKYVLIAEVLFSNIGGTATAIGDPPNVLIIGNSALKHKGVAFGNMTLHLSFGIVIVTIVAYISLRILYRWKKLKNDDPPIIEELRREADIWQRTASRLCIGSPDEKTVKVLLLQKSMMIRNAVAKQVYRRPMDETCAELAIKYQIADFGLLIKTGLIVAAVIILFFIQILNQVHLVIGWIPVMGAIWLVLLADIQQLERIIDRVEWTTLIFFASLFVMMKGIAELGLIDVVGTEIQNLIRDVGEDNRLLVAIISIIWISAIVSSFIDNIPFTSAMIPVVLKLADDPTLKLPLKPLVYALAFGSCLGGNGTLVGASANLVAAGLSEQQGYRISFNAYFKIGFPVMLITVFVAMSFLLISHVAFKWDC